MKECKKEEAKMARLWRFEKNVKINSQRENGGGLKMPNYGNG